MCKAEFTVQYSDSMQKVNKVDRVRVRHIQKVETILRCPELTPVVWSAGSAGRLRPALGALKFQATSLTWVPRNR